MRIGSLFSGAGGLDMAVEAVFGARTVWQSEVDKAASKVLAHRFPGANNLGDITQIRWEDVEPVEILCGGFPCQDVSAAGRRAGIKDGTRSGLWSVFADAIDQLRPPIVVIENVRGLLSATAHRMESDEATLGDGERRPVLRAAGAVLGDLADLGYDAQWATVAAGDVGAPHRRERVFILATTADSKINRQSGNGFSSFGDESEQSSFASSFAPFPSGLEADTNYLFGHDHAARGWGVDLLPTPTTQDGANNGGPSQFQRNTLPLNAEVMLLPTPRSTDCFGAGRHGDGGMDLRTTVTLLPTPTSRDGDGGGVNPNSDMSEKAGPNSDRIKGDKLRDIVKPMTQWGKYEPAIRRWEALTRPAPAPTEPNKNGNPRLSAAFSEWMMGWPQGWVTDPAIGISRNDQLRIVGNGVCPQQAAAALRYLLSVAAVTA